MAYDEEFAERIRAVISLRENWTERKMFGGLGFMLSGNMACGVTSESELMLRVAPEDFEAALAEDGVRQFEMSGKKMGGWLIVERRILETDHELAGWVDAGADHAAALPAK